MNQEQIDEIVKECYMEIGNGKEWAIGGIGDVKEFARRLVAKLSDGQEPVLKVIHGEVCYKSTHDDQSFGMWVPVTPEYSPFQNDAKFYLSPPLTADTCEDTRKDAELYRKGLTAIAQLISESYGVAGLHRNGDVAPWEELRTGGRFEDWLLDFDNALTKEKTK